VNRSAGALKEVDQCRQRTDYEGTQHGYADHVSSRLDLTWVSVSATQDPLADPEEGAYGADQKHDSGQPVDEPFKGRAPGACVEVGVDFDPADEQLELDKDCECHGNSFGSALLGGPWCRQAIS
jgi:hypothetical protein